MASVNYGPNVMRIMKQLQALLIQNQNQDGRAKTVERKPEPKATPDRHMLRSITVCPRCGRRGRVGATFGVRDMGGGKLRPQSWCRDCRKDPNRDEAMKWIRQHRGGRK